MTKGLDVVGINKRGHHWQLCRGWCQAAESRENRPQVWRLVPHSNFGESFSCSFGKRECPVRGQTVPV